MIEVEGEATALERFAHALADEAPDLALVESLDVRHVEPRGETEFRIEPSAAARQPALIPPDAATCDACLRELFDPSDRRYRYPFINCTAVRAPLHDRDRGPYDRPRTTMARLPDVRATAAASTRIPRTDVSMPSRSRVPRAGPGCHSPSRRPPRAVPRRVHRRGQRPRRLSPRVRRRERAGGRALRARKHREDKPFAVMARDPGASRGSEPRGAALLTSPRAADRARTARGRRARRPVGRPRDAWLGAHAAVHAAAPPPARGVRRRPRHDERQSLRRADRVRGRRRAGAARRHRRRLPRPRPPDPSPLRGLGRARRPSRPPLARVRPGGAAPAARRPRARSSPREPSSRARSVSSAATRRSCRLTSAISTRSSAYRAFLADLELYLAMLDVEPEVIAHDLHPDYLATKWALERDADARRRPAPSRPRRRLPRRARRDGPALALVFDGTGYGTDGTVWGGELLRGDLASASSAPRPAIRCRCRAARRRSASRGAWPLLPRSCAGAARTVAALGGGTRCARR